MAFAAYARASSIFFVGVACELLVCRNILRRMVSLSDNQLQTIMTAAAAIELGKRSTFLERCAAMLKFRMVDDAAVREVVGLAQCGLVHRNDAA